MKQIVGGQILILPLRTDSSAQTIHLFFSGETNNGNFQLLLLNDKEEVIECMNDGFIEEINTTESSDDFIDYFDISKEKPKKRSGLSETSSSSEECRARYSCLKLKKELIVNVLQFEHS